MKFKEIDWSKQHCGVHQGTIDDLEKLMPDLTDLIWNTFPDLPTEYTWDVKVHMLMAGQYPCIPNWHRDMVPRDKNGKEDLSKLQLDKKMYLWLSGGPLTEFRETGFVEPQKWHEFTQNDEHRGHPSSEFCWRGLIRATHNDLRIGDKNVNNPFGKHSAYRRHTQVYLDANNFNW